MKIIDIVSTPITVDFTEPEIWSQGERPAITAVIVEIMTDSGIVGIGESVPAPSPEVTIAAIQSAKEFLLGKDPRRPRALWTELQRRGWRAFHRVGNAALAGVEMALWDVLGHSVGASVSAMLGGKIRDQVEFMGFVQNTDPDRIVTDAARMAADGYRTLYTKVGFGMHTDIEAARALRAGGGPNVQLRIDPNESWTPGDTLRIATQLVDTDLQYIEQPILSRSVSEMASLRERCPVPIAANQSSWTNEETFGLLSRQAADVMMTDPWQAGGIANFLGAAAMCESAGIPLVYHSFAPLSIATRAAMQVLAVSPACFYAHQTYNHMCASDVVDEPIDIQNGVVTVDDRPGLGVTLDRDKLAEHHEDFVRRGHVSPFGRAGVALPSSQLAPE